MCVGPNFILKISNCSKPVFCCVSFFFQIDWGVGSKKFLGKNAKYLLTWDCEGERNVFWRNLISGNIIYLWLWLGRQAFGQNHYLVFLPFIALLLNQFFNENSVVDLIPIKFNTIHLAGPAYVISPLPPVCIYEPNHPDRSSLNISWIFGVSRF